MINKQHLSNFLRFGPALIASAPISLSATVYLTQDQALKIAFSQQEKIERKSLFLNSDAKASIEKTSKTKCTSQLINYYVGEKDGKITGIVFFSSHIVRTMPETIMIVLNPNGHIRAVEILAFYEPEDYRPPKRWLDQFSEKNIQNDLWVKREIRNMSGATLTAQAIAEEVRRTLAIFDITVSPQIKGESTQ